MALRLDCRKDEKHPEDRSKDRFTVVRASNLGLKPDDIEITVETEAREAFRARDLKFYDMDVSPHSANFLVHEEMRWVAPNAQKLVIKFMGEVVSTDRKGENPVDEVVGKRQGATMVATAFALIVGTHSYKVEVEDSHGPHRIDHSPTAQIRK